MDNILKKHKKKLEIAEDIVIVILFVGLIILLISVVLGNSPFFYVEGISMHPTLENGDLIVMDRTNFDNLKVGDIIVFDSSIYNFRIVHRIIDIGTSNGDRILFTQGDNNHIPDPSYVKRSDYIGKYVGIRVPYAGFVGQALAPPINYVIIVILVIYLIYIDFYVPRKEKSKPPINNLSKEKDNN